jgi:hypothetical protein
MLTAGSDPPTTTFAVSFSDDERQLQRGQGQTLARNRGNISFLLGTTSVMRMR